ncbi:hypothetical protein ACFSLT_09725 [Novosphingobium resinovorum]
MASEEALPMASTEAPSEAPAVKGRSEKEENDLYEFGYSYPDAAAALPGLRAMLDRKLDDTKGELVSSARSDKAEMTKDGFPITRIRCRWTGRWSPTCRAGCRCPRRCTSIAAARTG